MNKVGRFGKVSKKQFLDDLNKRFKNISDEDKIYEEIKKPKRGTKGSAGYDFYLPMDIVLEAGESIVIPTGIRAYMIEGWVLTCFPRSGLGMKYRLQLDNTVGIIDSDYFYADNEGHIMIPLTNDSKQGKTLELKAGDRFAQCIFMPFGIVEDDDCQEIRTGGFGSTDKKL